MLTWLYTTLLKRHSRAFPPAVAEEMLATFEEARKDAARRGAWAYVRFGTRELRGVVWTQAGARRRTGHQPLRFAFGCALLGVAIAGAVVWAMEPRYASSATLWVTDSTIPPSVIPASAQRDARANLRNQIFSVMSRRTLVTMVQIYDLYRSERMRMPMEDVLDRMRRDIWIYSGSSDDTVQISFRYREPRAAQKVVQDLMTRLIDQSARERSLQLQSTTSFLTQRMEAAAKTWMEAEGLRRKLAASDPQSQRASLDAALAQRDYESLRARVSEARLAEAAAAWTKGATLEVIDLPSLPERNERNVVAILLAGLLGGGLLGAVFAWVRLMRGASIRAMEATAHQ